MKDVYTAWGEFFDDFATIFYLIKKSLADMPLKVFESANVISQIGRSNQSPALHSLLTGVFRLH